MRGLALNGNLIAAGATFVCETTAAPLSPLVDRRPSSGHGPGHVRAAPPSRSRCGTFPPPASPTSCSRSRLASPSGGPARRRRGDARRAWRAGALRGTARDHEARRLARLPRRPRGDPRDRIRHDRRVRRPRRPTRASARARAARRCRPSISPGLFVVATLVMEFPLPDDVEPPRCSSRERWPHAFAIARRRPGRGALPRAR